MFERLDQILSNREGMDTSSLRAAIEAAFVEFLSHPDVIHNNMLRGTIAKPSIRNMLHLYGSEALERWDNSFIPAYVYYSEAFQDDEKHFICGQVHAANKDAARALVADRTNMLFPQCERIFIVLGDNHMASIIDGKSTKS